VSAYSATARISRSAFSNVPALPAAHIIQQEVLKVKLQGEQRNPTQTQAYTKNSTCHGAETRAVIGRKQQRGDVRERRRRLRDSNL
jgi:hypothetical protein